MLLRRRPTREICRKKLMAMASSSLGRGVSGGAGSKRRREDKEEVVHEAGAPPPPIIKNGAKWYIMEKIVAERENLSASGQVSTYKCRWKGYSEEYDTWERASQIPDVIMDAYTRVDPKPPGSV